MYNIGMELKTIYHHFTLVVAQEYPVPAPEGEDDPMYHDTTNLLELIESVLQDNVLSGVKGRYGERMYIDSIDGHEIADLVN